MDKGKGKNKELDPERAILVRKAFELYATGKYNLLSLVDDMYKLGLRNRNGHKVTRNGFSTMLNNPFYIGLMHIRQTDETFPGSHRPLIPKSLFNRVQRVLEGKTNTKVQLHDFLFPRLITCKNCGHSVSGEIQKGHTYYRCQTRSCPTTCIREEQIEEAVMRMLTPMQFSEDERVYIRQKVASLKEEWVKEQESAITTLNLRLSQIQERMSRLTDSYIDRIIERDVFEERKTALLMERKDLEEKRDQMQREGHLIPDRLAEFLELAGSAYLSYKLMLPSEKREFLKIATSNRQVEEKNVLLTPSFPFEEVANRSKNTNSTPERDRPRTLEKCSQEAWDRLLERLTEFFKGNPSPWLEVGCGANLMSRISGRCCVKRSQKVPLAATNTPPLITGSV